jgi:uncharacterized membrane protein YGL010W
MRVYSVAVPMVMRARRVIIRRFPVLDITPSENPIPAMCLLGLSYAVFTASIWPSM